MLDHPAIRFLAIRLPRLLSGRRLHRMALEATRAGDYRAAEALYDRAADRYVIDLEIEALARLRVHQLIARVRATREPLRDAATCLEVEQRLLRLDWIEALEAPFELVPASRLLAGWLSEHPASAPAMRVPGGARAA